MRGRRPTLRRPPRNPAGFWAALAVLLLLAAGPAQAKVYIDINAPTLRQIPLAVPALKRTGGEVGRAHLEVAETLRNDLAMSGLFELLDPRGYLEDPQRAPVHPGPGSFADWFAVGAEVLVKGQVSARDGQLAVELWAYDVLRRELLFSGRQYTTGPSAARAVAHMFANTVLEEFTGTPGPFGTRIAYVVQDGAVKELALADMDGANPLRLTRTGSLNLNPSWSRDGRYLYFTSYQLGEPDLFLLDLTSWKQWVVSRQPGIDLAGRDAPDGTELLVVLSMEGNSEIYRMDKSTRRLTRLTRSRAIDVAPTWSPDGRRIAFVSDRLGNPHIFVMDRDGGDVRRITFTGRHNGDPDWSPRGDVIAFSGQDESGVFQVHAADLRTGDVRQLSFGSRDTLDPSWSPDGRFLSVTSFREGQSAVYVFRVGSQRYYRVSPRGTAASQAAWAPDSVVH